ncbi:MAG TPA: hypothetical protein VLV86_01400 [Vicinamibacterales bacterium]|nr:hypothetical protein [Vicinamibacterales bacterium]
MKAEAVVIAIAATVTAAAGQAPVKSVKTPSYVVAKTPWGDPDLQGAYTDKDENGIPMEKPSQFQGKSLDEVDDSELADIVKERQERAAAGAAAIGGADTGAGPVHWYEHYNAKNSRAWLVLDPPDGRTPDQVPAVQQRNAARAAVRGGRGAADSYEDRSLYDRCITRGIVGSMLPVIYGNSFQFVQGPGYVAIRYEMIHETRVIPLTARPHISSKLHMLMGDPRGHFEGNTLVVETMNFTDRTALGVNGGGIRHSEKLRLVERFTPISANAIEWRVTVDDPDTWVKPWTFALNLTKDSSQPVFEYACHEGNYAMRNILSAARAEERAAK